MIRKAIVYLRQSSEKRVRQNLESQRLQYELAERIRSLGWQDIEVINSDLGRRAGLGSAVREGFERVLSAVALVLGIKGTLSVVELKVLRQRLQAGQESKARRGELLKRLPVGYAKDGTGKVVLHADQRVCEAIRLVLAKFRELWSVRQTFQWFRDHDVELPANPIHGARLV